MRQGVCVISMPLYHHQPNESIQLDVHLGFCPLELFGSMLFPGAENVVREIGAIKKDEELV